MTLDLLDGEAIVRITGVTRPADQMRRLREIGCYAWQRADGSVATTVAHLHAAGKPSGAKLEEPYWRMIG